MQIPINKDLESAYKDEFFKGFSIRETIYIIVGFIFLIIGGSIGFFIFGLPLVVCVYVGIPFAVPPIFLGMYEIQGLTVWQYLMEMNYERKTRILIYDADEIPQNDECYSMILSKKRRGIGK